MSTIAVEPKLMTIEEYLHTSFRPDCDFVDGQVEERNVCELGHGLVQAEIVIWFGARRADWNIRVIPEYRTRVGTTRVRVPEVMVVDADSLREQVRVTAPLIAIEILSPEDRLPRVLVRLEDFRRMGVEHIWLLDPEERMAWTYTHSGLRQVEGKRIEVAGTPVYMDLDQVFAGLD